MTALPVVFSPHIPERPTPVSKRDKFETTLHSPPIPKPYCSVGAGPLTSFVWKTGDADSGWRFRFNIFRLFARGGRVSQLFQPADLLHFVKLIQVLASVLADDGCLTAVDRGVLNRLATELDNVLTNPRNTQFNNQGAIDGNTSHS